MSSLARLRKRPARRTLPRTAKRPCVSRRSRWSATDHFGYADGLGASLVGCALRAVGPADSQGMRRASRVASGMRIVMTRSAAQGYWEWSFVTAL